MSRNGQAATSVKLRYAVGEVVLDMQPFNKVDTRSWIFRTIGYGHDAKMWADFVTALKLSGYNHVISIEHEDELIEGLEGVSKAAKLLREVIVR